MFCPPASNQTSASRSPGTFIFTLIFAIAFAVGIGCQHPDRWKTAWNYQTSPVGRIETNQYVTPTGQLLTPAGTQIELPAMRPQVLALSPNGRLLVTAGKSNVLAVLDARTGEVLQRVRLATNRTALEIAEEATIDAEDPALAPPAPPPSAKPSTNKPGDVEMSLTGLAFAPDGKRIYMSTIGGKLRAFRVDSSNRVGRPLLFSIPDIKGKAEIPTGIAVSQDSAKLYVAGNVANKLYELDVKTGKVLRSWDTGVAPYDVALVRDKAYVSNLGGRRPTTNDLSALAGRGTRVRVDPVRYIANEGSVSVINLKSGVALSEIAVELHPSALALSPNKRYLVVANSGSDTLSVIDTRSDKVVEKISTRENPADLFGAQPNALAFNASGRRLYVCNGTQNAVAVVQFEPEENASRVLGLIPVGWFPGAVVFNGARKTLAVANIKGIGAIKNFKPGEKIKRSSKDFYGTINFVPVPAEDALAAMTRTALRNMRYPKLAEALLPPRPDQPPRAVPERAGEPSLIKHVIYVIKENRTYDQILGDMPQGNGDTNLCTFGEKYTPNQHKIARDFALLDNTYCSGVQSADGHQWTDSGLANEYTERQLTAGFPRSYAGAKAEDASDALAWASSGFIWDNALAHGKSFRNYGEWMISEANWVDKARQKTNATWQDFWKDYTNNTRKTFLKCKPGIESLRKYSKLDTVGWDLKVPDVMRAAKFIEELRQFETNGNFPQLIILFLPNDHTGGTKTSEPSPGAQIADNDLALGRVVEALTRSKFWPETCLLSIEDDPQAGWDHVSGYRTTCYVVSPYTKRRQTISTQYNHLSLLRTIELMLGLPPMNFLDATATPMSDCFTDSPDLTPFASVPNTFPLDNLNPPAKKVADAILRRDILISARLPLDEMDKCPEDLFNRILWRAMKGSKTPYPEWAVKTLVDKD